MYSVIIVDDEIMAAKAIGKYISQYFKDDFTVASCMSDASEALEYMDNHTVHLVITDINMPEIDGLEFSRRIKEKFPFCAIIIVTGYNKFEYAKLAIKYNVFYYILKPVDYSEMKECLISIKEHFDKNLAASTDYISVASEMFFLDLFLGSISTFKEFKKRLDDIAFPFSLDTHKGFVLKVSLMQDGVLDTWSHGKESLENLILNMINVSHPGLKSYLITKQGLTFYIISFYEPSKGAPDFMSFPDKLKKAHNLYCIIEVVAEFSQLHSFIKTNILSDKLQFSAENGDSDELIKSAIGYINANYQNDISRDDVSSAVFMSAGYFSYYFKKHTNMTFSSYLTNLRMEKAISLLTQNIAINEIMRLTGYRNKNVFLLNFKKYTSCTPTEYRKRLLQRMGDDVF